VTPGLSLRAKRGNPLTAWIATAYGLAMTARGFRNETGPFNSGPLKRDFST